LRSASVVLGDEASPLRRDRATSADGRRAGKSHHVL
jgi:hypothetical protein